MNYQPFKLKEEFVILTDHSCYFPDPIYEALRDKEVTNLKKKKKKKKKLFYYL